MIDPGVAWDKLSNFETAEEIRQYFVDEGIKATRNRADTCAIAKWMNDTTGLSPVFVGTRIEVGKKTVSKKTVSKDRDPGKYSFLEPAYVFAHTDATMEFITKFDEGDYPELVAEKSL